MKVASNKNLLSVFWYVDGQFIGYDEERNSDHVIPVGDYLQIDKDHYFLWDVMQSVYPKLIDFEYDDYPRGRVMFNCKINKFVVCADRKIVNDDAIRQKLIEHFGLPVTTIFDTDEHYQSNF